MSHKGYGFESEIEDFFLAFTKQTKKDPILKADESGFIRLNRTFRIPTSGAMDSMKGDVMTAIIWLPRQLKVECKSRYTSTKRDGATFTVEIEWITKNNAEAAADNQIPALVFSFKRTKDKRIWWIMRKHDFDAVFGKGKTAISHEFFEAKPMFSEKKDKFTFAHKVIGRPLGSTAIQTFHLMDELYYLIPHDLFQYVMENIRP